MIPSKGSESRVKSPHGILIKGDAMIVQTILLLAVFLTVVASILSLALNIDLGLLHRRFF